MASTNWNRRDFVKTSALAAVAGVIPQRTGAQQPAATPPPAPAIFTPLRRNVGIFNQRGGTIGWLINGDGVLVIDSQFADTAPNLLSGLKERSPRQIDVLINSHHHPDHTGGDAAIHFQQANIVHLGDPLNNRGYPNVDAPAGASVHGWIQVLEKMAPAYPADALYVYGHAEAGHPFIGTRPDLLYQRDYFTAVIEMAAKARKEGRSREELAKVEVLPKFEHFGGTKARLGLALGIAYDELAKIG